MSPISLHRYGYGYANPLLYVDPNGRRGCDSMQCTLLQARNLAGTEAERERIDVLRERNLLEEAGKGDAIGDFVVDSVVGTAELGRDIGLAELERHSSGLIDLGGQRAMDERAAALWKFASNDPVGTIRQATGDRLELADALERSGDIRGATRVRYGLMLNYTSAGIGGYGLLRSGVAGVARLGRVTGVVTEGGIDAAILAERRGALNADNDFGLLNQQSSLAETSTPGLLRDTRTGRFVSDPFALRDDVAAPATGNRNLRSTQEPTIFYRIDVDGEGRKVGISSVPPTTTGRYTRPAEQVSKLREIYGPDVEIEYRKRREFPDRASALDYETAFLDRFKRLYGQYPGEGLPGGNKTNR